MQIVAGLKHFEPLLHYGCPDSSFVDYMTRRGFTTFGFNPELSAPSPYMFHTLPQHEFNAVVAVNLFEWSPNPTEELARIAELLPPGGALFLELDFSDEVHYSTCLETVESAGFSYVQSATERVLYFSKAH